MEGSNDQTKTTNKGIQVLPKNWPNSSRLCIINSIPPKKDKARRELLNIQANSIDVVKVHQHRTTDLEQSASERPKRKRRLKHFSRDFIFYSMNVTLSDEEGKESKVRKPKESKGRKPKEMKGKKQKKEKRVKSKPKVRVTSVIDDFSDVKLYREYRDKNNESCKRWRLNRKLKQVSLYSEIEELEERNRHLHKQIGFMEKLKTKIKVKMNQLLLEDQERSLGRDH